MGRAARQEGGRESPEDFVGQVRDYAIIRLGPDGTIESWNEGAARLKGYTAAEAVGRSFTMFYPEEDRRRGLPLDLLAAARSDGRVEHKGWRLRKDGSLFWGDVVITALRDGHGALTGFAKVTRDLTTQHELETRLRESEARLRLLVGQVVDYAIIALGPQGTIESWNQGAVRLKGYAAEEAIGRSFAMFYPDEDRRRGLPAALLARARAQGSVEHTGWRVRKDGTRFWGDVVITVLHDEAGVLTGYVKVTRDLSDRKALEDAQDAFYSTFEHDFRTPLTTLRGIIETMHDADEDLREHLIGRAEQSADRLLVMVHDLVEFATQRAGHVRMRLDEVDVAAVARGVVDALPPDLDTSRVLVDRGRFVACANAMAMHRVLTNLLTNALKYSATGSAVRVSFDTSAPGRTRISVADSGRGIEASDLDTIFERYTRGRLAEDDGGSGLGLASVRELVGQQRGTVTIESEPRAGTTVVVDVPSSLRP